MFNDIKRKAEELKKLAKEKKDSIERLDVKDAIEKSKATVFDTLNKATETTGQASTNAKLAISNSTEIASQAACDAGIKAKKIFDSTVHKTTTAIGDTATVAKTAMVSGAESAGAMYEKYGPTIEKIVVNGLIDIAEEKLQDEIFLRSSLEKAYELLPVSVRLVISRDVFFDFCVARKEPILVKIKGYKEQVKEDILLEDKT